MLMTATEKHDFYNFQDQFRSISQVDVVPVLQPSQASQTGLGLNLMPSQFDVEQSGVIFLFPRACKWSSNLSG